MYGIIKCFFFFNASSYFHIYFCGRPPLSYNTPLDSVPRIVYTHPTLPRPPPPGSHHSQSRQTVSSSTVFPSTSVRKITLITACDSSHLITRPNQVSSLFSLSSYQLSKQRPLQTPHKLVSYAVVSGSDSRYSSSG